MNLRKCIKKVSRTYFKKVDQEILKDGKTTTSEEERMKGDYSSTPL